MNRPISDNADMRRVVRELVDSAPSAHPWAEIDTRASLGSDQTRSSNDARPHRNLMLVAAAAVVAVGAGAVIVTSRGSDSDRLVPLDTTIVTTDAPTPSTSSPRPSTTADPVVVEPVPDTAFPTLDDTFDADDTTDELPDDFPLPNEVTPVDYPELPLADATRLPVDAWVTTRTLPDGFTARYATADEFSRAVAYGDGDRSITIRTDQQPIGGSESIDVDGIEWTTDGDTDAAFYHRTIGTTTVSVDTIGLDISTAVSVLADLRTGGDQLLEVEPIRGAGTGLFWDANIVALDIPDGTGVFEGPFPTFRARGNNGWYCVELDFVHNADLGCGFGRDGALSNTVTISSSGVPNDDGDVTIGFAGIVSPEVVLVEIVFSDGTTQRARPGDITGLHRDRFWITSAPLPEVDAFTDPFADLEVRLYGGDGSVLGTAPLPDF